MIKKNNAIHERLKNNLLQSVSKYMGHMQLLIIILKIMCSFFVSGLKIVYYKNYYSAITTLSTRGEKIWRVTTFLERKSL